MWGTMRKVMMGFTWIKTTGPYRVMALAGFHIKLVIIFLITYKQIKQTKFKTG